MSQLRVVAVDLGATSGRIMTATVSGSHLDLQEVHRFPNGAVRLGQSLVWDVVGVHREVLAGLRESVATGPVNGIAVDSWAVDYGLLDRDGGLIGSPFSHRDSRTDGVAEQVGREISAAELYAITGLQHLPFNTLYQLVAAQGTAALEAADTMLLLPDLLGYWLTGQLGAEHTNASTTQLYDVTRREWAVELADRLGIRSSLLPPLREAGEVVGSMLPDVASEVGLSASIPVIGVGSHDTASAVVAVPADTVDFGYISSGTWSLVGLELERPVLSEAARAADFTNEGGVDGTTRFLKNVTGLWVLSECVSTWSSQRVDNADLVTVLSAAADAEPLRTVLDISDPRLLPPSTAADPMPNRVRALAQDLGEPMPKHPDQVARCVLDSLALAYRRHLRTAGELAGRQVEVVHIVGGGSQNELLCQLTADACGLPVLAGPAEAAALGNALVQARTLGVDLPDLAAMRRLLRQHHDLKRYDPRSDDGWDRAESRLEDHRNR